MKTVLRITVAVYAVLGGLLALVLLLDIEALAPIRHALVGGNDFAFAFAYPWVLLSGLLVVPLLVLALTRKKRKAVGTMAFTRGDLLVTAPVTWRQRLEPLLPLLRAAGAFVLVFALARPQVPAEELIEAEGIDIYVILDMSGSMQAIDLTPAQLRQYQVQNLQAPNRFDIARSVLADFVERRRENPWYDRIGMVVFARHAFLQFPLTIDYDTILWLLARLDLNVIDPSQTAIGNALGRAVLGLLDSETSSKIVVLITDGDERGGNLSALEAAQMAADEGIEVYPILVGREGPVLVPADRTAFGHGQRYMQREYPVDPELLIEVSRLTGGEFFRAENQEGLETTLEEIIAQYEKTAHQETIRHRRIDIYFGFVFAAFLLLGIEVALRYGPLRKFP